MASIEKVFDMRLCIKILRYMTHQKKIMKLIDFPHLFVLYDVCKKCAILRLKDVF